MRPILGFFATAMAVAWAGQAPAQEDLSFRDDFTGSKLAPEFRNLNPDPNRMALVEGDYLLLLTHKDKLNTIRYESTMPEDYEVIVRFSDVPKYVHQIISL